MGVRKDEHAEELPAAKPSLTDQLPRRVILNPFNSVALGLFFPSLEPGKHLLQVYKVALCAATVLASTEERNSDMLLSNHFKSNLFYNFTFLVSGSCTAKQHFPEKVKQKSKEHSRYLLSVNCLRPIH